MQTSKQLQSHKRRMKRNPTRAEKAFMHRLDEAGIAYKPQMILGFYILDICIPDKLLDIEIDGESHTSTSDYDARRDRFSKSCGFRVIRIPNNEVLTFPLSKIERYKTYPFSKFRSGLARANSLRSIKIRKQRLHVRSLLGVPNN